MKRLVLSVLAVVMLVMAGCQDSRMQEFSERETHILVDESSGKRYAVRHHLGNTYSLTPIKEKAQ